MIKFIPSIIYEKISILVDFLKLFGDKMTRWRPLPHLHLDISGKDEEEIYRGYLRIFSALNLALMRTFKGQGYKKFGILFSTIDDENNPIFEIFCHEVEFMKDFELILFNKIPRNEIKQGLEILQSDFNQRIYKIPTGRFIAASVVLDEQKGVLSLGETPLQMSERTTSGMLFFIGQMIHSNFIMDPNGILFEYDPLRKMVVYNMDKESINFSQIQINVDNFEEWDYLYPEYDHEVENHEKLMARIIEKAIPDSTHLLKIPENPNEFHLIVKQLLFELKDMVETEGYKLLIDESGHPRNENICQTLFYLYLKNICKSHNIDLTREPAIGRGNIDFRFSSTVNYIAHVEIKTETNPKLKAGIIKQLPTYMKAEGVNIGFLIIFNFGRKSISHLLKSIEDEIEIIQNQVGIVLEFIVIDSRKKKTASLL